MAEFDITGRTVRGFRREEYESGRIIHRSNDGSFTTEEKYKQSNIVHRTLLHRGYYTNESGHRLEAEVKIWKVSLESHDLQPLWSMLSDIESNEGLLNMQTRDLAMEYNEQIDSDELQESFSLDQVHNRVWFKDRSYAYVWNENSGQLEGT